MGNKHSKGRGEEADYLPGQRVNRFNKSSGTRPPPSDSSSSSSSNSSSSSLFFKGKTMPWSPQLQPNKEDAFWQMVKGLGGAVEAAVVLVGVGRKVSTADVVVAYRASGIDKYHKNVSISDEAIVREYYAQMQRLGALELQPDRETIPRCPKLHILARHHSAMKGWICDSCFRADTNQTVVRMRCMTCDYDLCGNCYGKADQTTLKDKLSANPHFPAPELELLPTGIVSAIKLNFNPSTFHVSTYMMARSIHCCAGPASKLLDKYLARIPSQNRNISVVHIDCEDVTFNDETTVGCITRFYSAEEGSGAAHTLVLCHASTELICAVLEAAPPKLLRLVLQDCGRLDCLRLLRLLIRQRTALGSTNQDSPLLEIPIQGRQGPRLTGSMLPLFHECQTLGISFDEQSDLMNDLPRCLQSRVEGQPPLVLAMSASVAEQMAMDTGDTTSLGLMIDGGGSEEGEPLVVPLPRNKADRFLLLAQLLEGDNNVNNNCSGAGASSSFEGSELTDEERFIPIQIQPPVSPEAVALAVHFVTHHVSDEAHRDCVEQEATLVATDANAPRYYWNPSFEEFKNLVFNAHHPAAQSSTPEWSPGGDGVSRIKLLAEMMAVAAYLNAPSLKRFLRAVLATELSEVAMTSSDDSSKAIVHTSVSSV